MTITNAQLIAFHRKLKESAVPGESCPKCKQPAYIIWPDSTHFPRYTFEDGQYKRVDMSWLRKQAPNPAYYTPKCFDCLVKEEIRIMRRARLPWWLRWIGYL